MRVLVIDFTPSGDGTATGELKSALFAGLDDTPIMQVSAPGNALEYGYPTLGAARVAPDTIDDLIAAVDAFAPTVILTRPTHERESLWLLSLALWSRYDVPLVTWVMDDWVSVIPDPQLRERYEASLKTVFEATGRGLSICDEMSGAFTSRFGAEFTAIANGIDTAGEFADFTPRVSEPGTPFVFRYAGALAGNMGVNTLEKVARAIKRLRTDGLDVQLEIKTRRYWIEKEGSRFEGINGIGISRSGMDRPTYLAWLSEADCNLICYNFSEASLRYVRYSLANKLPELLGVGAPALGIGPAEIPAIRRLKDLSAGFALSSNSDAAMERCLRDIATNRHRLHDVATRGRQVAETEFDLKRIRQRFVGALETAIDAHTVAKEGRARMALSAADGFDLDALPFSFRDVMTPVDLPEPATIAPIETQPSEESGDEGEGDMQVPPRPEKGEVLFTRRSVKRLRPVNITPQQARAEAAARKLPLTLSRPVNRKRPWLEGKAKEALAFCRNLTEPSISRAQASAPSAPELPEKLDGLDGCRPFALDGLKRLNGAGIERIGVCGFVLHRHAAAAGHHASLNLGNPGDVAGIALLIGSVVGRVEILESGNVLAEIDGPGRIDIAFDTTSPVQRLFFRCVDRLDARMEVTAIGALVPA